MAAPTSFIKAIKNLSSPPKDSEIQDLWDAITSAGSLPRKRGGGNDYMSEIKAVKKEIKEIEENVYHTKDIIDRIGESERIVKDLTKERNKLNKECNDLKKEEKKLELELAAIADKTSQAYADKLLEYQKKELEYSQKKSDVEKADLDMLRAKVRLRELEQEKQISGYNKIDRFGRDFSNRVQQLKTGVNEVKEGVKQIGDSVSKMVGPWTKMSQAAADYAKNIGLSGRAMDYLRKSTINLVANRGIGARYNTSVEELIGLQQSYTKGVGRQVGLTGNDLEVLAASSRILGNDTAADFMAKFERFGLSMEDAGDRAGKMFADASKRGISWENYSKNFLDNITLAQRYTFRNGTRGLESMARKATEINLNLSQAASFAEKVNTVEGAIRTGAQLQVLGGPFAQMGNPIGMLYESLNDMEALQDRMVQMFGNLGSFNKQTGEVEISAFNRMRINEAAKSMGIDAANIFESINSNARRNEIARQLQGNQNGLSQDVINLVKNTGTIRNGVAGVTINGSFKRANEITNADQRALMEISRSESDDIKDIATRLRGWEDSVQGFTKQREAVHGQLVESMGIGRGVQQLINDVGEMKAILKTLAIGTMVAGGIGAVAGGFSLVKGGSHIIGGTGNLLTNRLQLGRARVRASGGYNTVRLGTAGTRRYDRITGEIASKGTGALKSGGKGIGNALARARANSIGYAASNSGKIIGRTANIAGIAGAGISIGTDFWVNANKNRRGRLGDYAGHMLGDAASFTALGTQIGTMIAPGIGTAIGGAVMGTIGLVTGAVKARKNELYRKIFEESEIDLVGKYNKGELKQIRSAMHGGDSISASLREKMEMQGDAAMVSKLDSIANNIIADGAVKTRVVGTQKKATGGIVEGSHTTGDREIVMSNAGEMVLNKSQQENLFKAIDSGNIANLTPIVPRTQSVSVAPPIPPAPKPMKIDFGDMNINFRSDDIRLIDPSGKSTSLNIDTDSLKKQIEQNLLLKISEQLERMNHAGRLIPEKGYLYQQK